MRRSVSPARFPRRDIGTSRELPCSLPFCFFLPRFGGGVTRWMASCCLGPRFAGCPTHSRFCECVGEDNVMGVRKHERASSKYPTQPKEGWVGHPAMPCSAPPYADRTRVFPRRRLDLFGSLGRSSCQALRSL